MILHEPATDHWLLTVALTTGGEILWNPLKKALKND